MGTIGYLPGGRSGKDRRQRQAFEPERRLHLPRRQSDIVPVKQIRSGRDRRERHPACSIAVPERRLRLSRRESDRSSQSNHRPPLHPALLFKRNPQILLEGDNN
jgi:hypothetical protein